MTTTSFPIALSFQSSGNITTLSLSTPPLDSSVELEGTAVDPNFEPDLEELPPTNPVFEPGETNQPPNPYEPSTDIFNHLLLPRITNAPSRVFNLSVKETTVLIDGLDFSPALYGLDWSVPINGVSQGSLELRQVEGIQLDPDFNNISQGSTVEITHTLSSTNQRLLTRCFVIGSPSYDLGDNGSYRLTLEIGDELSLLATTTRNRDLYCGPVPRNTQQLAQVYARVNGLRTRVFPVGHTIRESSVNNFLTESPFEFLSSIYSPINRDVRTNAQGSIIVPPRPKYDPSRAIKLNYRDVIESNNSFSQFYEPYTKVKASNDFNLEEPFTFRTRTSTQIQGNPQNTKPWFQGGYQETETRVTSLGDTDVHIEEITRGYIPIDARPWDAALVEEDPCAIGAFQTVLGIIKRKITRLTYQTHPSGSFLVNRNQVWENGLQIYQIDQDPEIETPAPYDLYNGPLTYELETYRNSPQVNSEVCQKDYNYVIINRRLEKFSLTSNRVFIFKSWEQESFTPSGESSTLGQSSFTGQEQTWSRVLNQGEFSEEDNVWIIQPTQNDINVSPPSSQFISPVSVSITNFSEFTLQPGNLEPRPLTAPFCYNKNQLDTISERYLREQYGLSKAKVVTMPLNFPLNIGESVDFTDRNGLQYPYLVWSREINQTENTATQSFVLLRVFNG